MDESNQSSLPVAQFPYRAAIDINPNEADVSIVSINNVGEPNTLSDYVMKSYGLKPEELPTSFDLRSGFYFLRNKTKNSVLFVVSTNQTPALNALDSNLSNSLTASLDYLENKKVWIAVETESAPIPVVMDTLAMIISILNSTLSSLKSPPTILFSLPSGDLGKQLQSALSESNKGLLTIGEAKQRLIDYAKTQIPSNFQELLKIIPSTPSTNEIHVLSNNSRDVKKVLDLLERKQVSARVDQNSNIPGVEALDLYRLSAKLSDPLKDYIGDADEKEYLQAQERILAKNIDIALKSEQSSVSVLINSYIRENEASETDFQISESSAKAQELEQPLDDSFLEEHLKEAQKTEEGLIEESAVKKSKEPKQKEEPEPPLPPQIIANTLQRVPLTSDSAHKGKDLLGFEQDVEAFAAIMALEKLTPPLAIALFGQWGTGKSFFMQKLSEKVAELARYQGFLKKEDEEEEGEVQAQERDEKPFCEGVCQIHFNAWSYMDTNLWASLVTRIFEKLDDYINDNRSEAEKEKDTIKSGIAEQLDVAKGQIAELEARKAQVQNAIDTLTEQVGTAQKQLTAKIDEIRNKSREEAITTAIENSKIKESLKAMLDKAGITQEKLDQVNPDLILKELKSSQTFVKQFLQFSPGDWILVALGVLLFVVPGLIPSELENGVFLGLEKIGAVITLIVGGLAKVRNTADKLSPLVNGVLKIKNDYDTAVSEAIAQHGQEILAKQIEADQKEVELNQLNLQLKAKEAEIKEMAYKPDSVLAQKAMYNFITRKAASNDYSRHLGIISMIRKDFQTLSELFVESTKAQKVPKKSKEKYAEFEKIRKGFDKPLQRIILYIDDLDRCPEERVVEVLEAVNLLMAFPLFVVVVGVDPRWVKNALIKKYHLQFTGHMKGSQEEVDSLGMEVINPSDYLEKIFQIPFHLKAPEDDSIKDMITHLLGDAVAEKPKVSESSGQEEVATESEFRETDQDTFFDEKPKGIRGIIDETGDHDIAEETAKSFNTDELDIGIPAMAGTEEAGEAEQSEEEGQMEDEPDTEETSEDEVPEGLKVVTPASLILHWEEREYMRNLSWLIGNTPRTVKRFVNMYRIIRAHEGLSYEDDESKKDLLCIMFLLALQTGPYKAYETRIKEALPAHNLADLTFDDLLTSEDSTSRKYAEAQDELPDYGYINFLSRLGKSSELKAIMGMQVFDIYTSSQFIERFRFQPVSFPRDNFMDDPYPNEDISKD